MMKKILVVDDQPGFGQLLQRAMKEYEVRQVAGATEALALTAEWLPDLFLLDLMMPDMHGMDLAARLCEDERLRSTPVIFLSALVHSPEGEAQPVMIDGYAAFGKPFKVEALRAHVVERLSAASSGRPPLKRGRIVGE
jgi:DNA-binding response OmpR family regulator